MLFQDSRHYKLIQNFGFTDSAFEFGGKLAKLGVGLY